MKDLKKWVLLLVGLLLVGSTACTSPPRRIASSELGSVRKPPIKSLSAPVATVWAPWQVDAMNFLTPNRGWLSLETRGNDHTGSFVPGSMRMAVYETTDGGRQWKLLHLWRLKGNGEPNGSFLTTFTRMTFLNPHNGWAVVDPYGPGAGQLLWGILRTTDGGRLWIPAGKILGSDGPVAMAFANASDGWFNNGSGATGNTGLWHSTDGGRLWEPNRTFSINPNPLASTATDLRFTSSSCAFLVNAYPGTAKSGPMLRAFSTQDGGTSWQPTDLSAGRLRGSMGSIQALSFVSPDRGWVALDQKTGLSLFATSDGGQDWRKLSLSFKDGENTRSFVNLDLVTPSVGYVNAEKLGESVTTLWKTTDGGATWRTIPLPALPSVLTSTRQATSFLPSPMSPEQGRPFLNIFPKEYGIKSAPWVPATAKGAPIQLGRGQVGEEGLLVKDEWRPIAFVKWHYGAWTIEIVNRLNKLIPVQTARWLVGYLGSHKLPSTRRGGLTVKIDPPNIIPNAPGRLWDVSLTFEKASAIYWIRGPLVRTLSQASTLSLFREHTYPSFAEASGAVTIGKEVRAYGTDISPTVNLGSGITARVIGDAGSYKYQWQEGRWTIVAHVLASDDTVDKMLKEVVSYLHTHMLPAPNKKGTIIISLVSSATPELQTTITWEEGIKVYKLQETGDPIKTLAAVVNSNGELE